MKPFRIAFVLWGALGAALGGALTGASPCARADDEPRAAATAAEEEYEDALARARGVEESLVGAVERVRVNTVSVFNLRRHTVDGQERLSRAGGGSGVIVRRKGKLWIITNVHVTEGHDALEVVAFDGQTHAVEQHDSIPEYDIALLKFSEKLRRAPYRGVDVDGRNSGKDLKEGTWVIATGNPFHLATDGASVATLGVVSGLDRFLGGQYQYFGVIQHDAEVNPGNSGGPLWNLKGDLIGINGMISTRQRFAGARPTNTGAAFALPVHQVEAFLGKLIGKDDAEAGFLGLVCETAMDEKGKAVGARVTDVDRRSPMFSEKDRPQPGDIVTSLIVRGLREARIYTAGDLLEQLSVLTAGTDVSIKYKSGSRNKRWRGKLGDKGR